MGSPVNVRNGTKGRGGRKTKIPGGLQPNFRPGSNAVSTEPAANGSFNSLPSTAPWNYRIIGKVISDSRLSETQTASSKRPSIDWSFCRTRVSPRRSSTFLRDRRSKHLDGIFGLSRVIQWSLRGDYGTFSRHPRRFSTSLPERKLIFALNVFSFAPLIAFTLREKQLHHLAKGD